MRRSSRLTFEKTFLIVATTWRRLANAFFTAIPQPSFSRPLYFSTLHRFSSFHASLLPRGRTLEHPTLPSFLSSTRSRTIVQAHSTIRFPYGAFPASSLSMASASIREIFGIEIVLSKYRIYPFLCDGDGGLRESGWEWLDVVRFLRFREFWGISFLAVLFIAFAMIHAWWKNLVKLSFIRFAIYEHKFNHWSSM